ncbi:MAG TPA: Gfo/Idh/MocA family oxidoreductase [Sneathiellales bacterium]|nr:Gfo/Idh/MocA family oxidoreductase [Sneathiellales bacterium]
MTTLRAGVIGLGVGEQHLKTYHGIEDVEVSSVCDINTDHLAAVANRYDVAGRFTDYRKITEDPNIDIVSICSYDDAHAEQAISAFNNGKHVMVEKPVALHRREAEAVLRAQQDSGCRISSNLILRESPRFIELREQIVAGDFGEIFCIEGDYLHEILWKITEGWRGQMDFYCTIYGGGIHLIDLMRWLIGQEVTEVCAMGNKVLTRDSSYRFEDSFMSILRFDGGALGKCLTTLGSQRTKFHSLNVYGSKKTFANDLPHAKMFEGDALENESVVETPYPGMKKGDLIPEFVRAIRNDTEPNVGVKDVFRIMDICFAAWEASQSGKTVQVSYLI